jgi:hypothetical protein
MTPDLLPPSRADASPFRPSAVQRYVQTSDVEVQLLGLSSRRISILWILVGVCIVSGSATLIAVLQATSV